MTQQEMILNHLKAGKSITQLEAWNFYHAFRLPQIINVLRKKGYDITTTIESNGKKQWAKYKLITAGNGGQYEIV